LHPACHEHIDAQRVSRLAGDSFDREDHRSGAILRGAQRRANPGSDVKVTVAGTLPSVRPVAAVVNAKV